MAAEIDPHEIAKIFETRIVRLVKPNLTVWLKSWTALCPWERNQVRKKRKKKNEKRTATAWRLSRDV